MSDLNEGTKEPQKDWNQGAEELYWLAFLITGNSELSIDLAVEALACHKTPSLRFADGILESARRLVMAAALASISGELTASAHRTQTDDAEAPELPEGDWALDRATTKAELEQALRGIDVFPRCALLLCVFERLSQDEAAIFLGCDRLLVSKAQVIGLRELTRNLATAQGWASAPAAIALFGLMRELQYA